MLITLTTAKIEQMRVLTAHLAMFAYVILRFPTLLSNLLIILNFLHVSKNSAATLFESKTLMRAPTPRLSSTTFMLLKSAITLAPLLLLFNFYVCIIYFASNFRLVAFTTTAGALIDFKTKARMPFNLPALPISFSYWNTSRLK